MCGGKESLEREDQRSVSGEGQGGAKREQGGRDEEVEDGWIDELRGMSISQPPQAPL